MVKALIFDLGKVVFDLSFERVFHYWGAASGRPAAELQARFQFDAAFASFETAAITPQEFRALIAAELGFALSDQDFDAGWNALYLDAYRGIDELLANLKRRYRLVALTNTNRLHSPVWQAKYARTLRYFEQVFSSHELKARKPDAAAYQLVLDYLQAAPAEVVFLDDNAANINGASQLGMQTILVTSYEQMVTELQTLGLLS